MANRGYSRKKFLINRRFQLTIIGFSVGLAFFAVAILYLENMFLLDHLFDKETQDIVFADSAMMQFIEEERSKIHQALGVAAATILVLIAVGGLFLSHRVAGPVYRLQTHMEDIIAGKTRERLSFRKKDFFPELAETYNALLDKLRK